jgi:thymidylate synthase (FAD)
MKVVEQGYEVLLYPDFSFVERAGRTCYKSEYKMDEENHGADFTERIIDRGHLAMVEFARMIVKFTTDRGVSHELVRHRMCSFAQESTRYCNYKDGVTFIRPSTWAAWSVWARQAWFNGMEAAELLYQRMLEDKLTPQLARAVLPNSLKTEIVVSANMREWMHIFKMRCADNAHPDMQALMKPLYDEIMFEFPFLREGSESV